jgi:anaerobic magnesium-protoporphyrin IX monomethyl ester cyclase
MSAERHFSLCAGRHRRFSRASAKLPPKHHWGGLLKILIINPPYHSLTSRYGVGAQTPLGLLWVGGALIDAGHEVSLLDAEALRLDAAEVAWRAAAIRPELIMTGHAGSTPAHPDVLAMARTLDAQLPGVPIVYGGVYPTYHGPEILSQEPAIDIIVRGEGERTAVALAGALTEGRDLSSVRGIVYRNGGSVRTTAPAEMIADIDEHRVGWELVEDWELYQCWGMGRAAVVQFSRGCPHQCTYCGQRGFWTKWRYRDVGKTVAEIAYLHREHGVNFIDLADENPTSSKRVWRAFLEALAAEKLPIKLFATIRATDIVRDADILPLYKAAGIDCVLMGMETTDPQTIETIRKGSTTRDDFDAIRLLRQHGILSMVGHIVGFEEETAGDYWRALRQLLLYDPDLLNAMYVTPHRWTAFYRDSIGREVIEADQSRWDYRHQILGTRHLRPWQTATLVKLTEAAVHLRPRALWRLMSHPDREIRRAFRWCVAHSSLVWLAEIAEIVKGRSQPGRGRSLGELAGAHLADEAPLVPASDARTPFYPARVQSGQPAFRAVSSS